MAVIARHCDFDLSIVPGVNLIALSIKVGGRPAKSKSRSPTTKALAAELALNRYVAGFGAMGP